MAGAAIALITAAAATALETHVADIGASFRIQHATALCPIHLGGSIGVSQCFERIGIRRGKHVTDAKSLLALSGYAKRANHGALCLRYFVTSLFALLRNFVVCATS
jgi:hypothetical protein